MRRALVLPLAVLACATAPRRAADAADPAVRVAAVADAYAAAFLAERPEEAYLAGVTPPRHDGLSDNSPAWIASWRAREDAWLAALDAIDPVALVSSPAWITHGVLREQLAASRQLRVCHLEEWFGVNHMFSWHLALAQVAELQPVDTAEHREQALSRWRKVPRYVRQEIENLRAGLARGYSVPRPVAERMLAQIDGLVLGPGAPATAHPYASPATRASDAAFRDAYLAVLEREVQPALREYRAFLAGEYLPKARTTLAVTALPDGQACYRALLRASTTLDRSAEEVYAIGRAAVARYTDEVRAMGKRLFGDDDFARIVQRVKDAPENHYADPKELLPDSKELVARAQAAMPRLFVAVPDQPVVVEPIPEYEDGAGASSHYFPPGGGRPGVFRLSLLRPGGTSRSEAEITAFHETWPGHHLQLSYAQRVKGLHPVTQLTFNSGYTEGWARYAEQLAEEVGLYRSDLPKIGRRAWPARGMVVDPGIHAMGWTREQAAAFLMESGRWDERNVQMAVDRIAALPGQLTSYDSGAQELFAVRRDAEEALGARFDLRRFDDALLDHGTITLPMLRARMQRWLAEERVRGEPR